MAGNKKQDSSKDSIPKQICIKCNKNKTLKSDYYSTSSNLYPNGNYPVCKQCVQEKLPEEKDPYNKEYLSIVQEILLELNKPYIHHLWLSSVEESKRRGWTAFNCYMKNVQLNNKDLTWKDSVFESTQERTSNTSATFPNNIQTNNDNLVDKWGFGYTDDEYQSFERKYNLLKNNYQEKTAMHTEALLTYVRYRVKEELATAQNDSKAAKEWGTLAKDAATAAKINPSQLSKSDLSDGLDTFGQLVRTVEQAVDIIPILPKFKEKPQDKVDFTIWCYINYIRDLKGLPPVEYKEIYEFYEIRKKEYEQASSGDDDEFI